MKNKQNKKTVLANNRGIHWIFQRFMKKSMAPKSTLGFDVSACSSMFHEKLQIIFANIRV
ncbi:hypothetical protein EQG68_11890 [Flavobacterium piscinae]|jgi:hypothetical protein|uniref:Uncharacterized protein n=1 Tax=Flavobacterium piscinae TaxID=2506424 RepID=A0A4Q1KMU6_9FLAO|nr:hypothetical protein [Flavobacterium piscinae]RXR30124.1 hypothetical protein EQG68_11890 [Flavobacterium piscinae]